MGLVVVARSGRIKKNIKMYKIFSRTLKAVTLRIIISLLSLLVLLMNINPSKNTNQQSFIIHWYNYREKFNIFLRDLKTHQLFS